MKICNMEAMHDPDFHFCSLSRHVICCSLKSGIFIFIWILSITSTLLSHLAYQDMRIVWNHIILCKQMKATRTERTKENGKHYEADMLEEYFCPFLLCKTTPCAEFANLKWKNNMAVTIQFIHLTILLFVGVFHYSPLTNFRII